MSHNRSSNSLILSTENLRDTDFHKNFFKRFTGAVPRRASGTELGIGNRNGFGLLKTEKSSMNFQKLERFLTSETLKSSQNCRECSDPVQIWHTNEFWDEKLDFGVGGTSESLWGLPETLGFFAKKDESFRNPKFYTRAN